MLLIKTLSVFWLHELQVLRKKKRSCVKRVAPARVFGFRKGWFWYVLCHMVKQLSQIWTL